MEAKETIKHVSKKRIKVRRVNDNDVVMEMTIEVPIIIPLA